MGLMYEHLNGVPSLYISSGLLLVVTVIGMAGMRGVRANATVTGG